MPMTASGMASKIRARIESLGNVQSSNPADVMAFRDTVLTALCQGIIDEIQANADVFTDSGAPDSEHHGKIV